MTKDAPQKDELYFFLDVETDGPVPGLDSMIELGMVCCFPDGEEAGRISLALHPLPDALRRESIAKAGCNAFWERFPKVLAKIQSEAIHPLMAMAHVSRWVSDIQFRENRSRGLVCVTDPAAFDYAFLRYYWERFVPNVRNPFEQRCFDMRSWWAGATGGAYFKSGKQGMKRAGVRWSAPHTHRAVEDAHELAERFFAARAFLEQRQASQGHNYVAQGLGLLAQGLGLVPPG